MLLVLRFDGKVDGNRQSSSLVSSAADAPTSE